MKRGFWSLAILVLSIVFLAIPGLANEIKVDIPASKGAFFYDFAEQNLTAGISSELISYKDRAYLEVGAVQGACLIGISYKLLDLERFGLVYRWAKAINVSVGLWMGYNLEEKKAKGGVYTSLLKVKF